MSNSLINKHRALIKRHALQAFTADRLVELHGHGQSTTAAFGRLQPSLCFGRWQRKFIQFLYREAVNLFNLVDKVDKVDRYFERLIRVSRRPLGPRNTQ